MATALPELLAALGLRLPDDPPVPIPLDTAPLAELTLHLTDPGILARDGTHRATAVAELRYQPANGAPVVRSERYPVTAPLGPNYVTLHDLAGDGSGAPSPGSSQHGTPEECSSSCIIRTFSCMLPQQTGAEGRAGQHGTWQPMKTDSLFYRLFQTVPQLLFDLIAQPKLDATRYHFASVELKQTALRVDGIFLPPAAQPDWPLFFVEVQFQRDPDLYSRLFAEVFLYLRQYQPVHPWQAVVLYPTPAVDPGAHRHYDLLLQSAQVTRVYLDAWAQPRQTLMQRVIGLLLTPPPQAMDEAHTLLTQLRAVGPLDPAQTAAIVNVVETILVYKLPTLSREEIQQMLELTDTDLKQTRFYQEVFLEGRQEGRQEGGVTLILRLLQRRCGELAPAVRERIARLPLPQLETLGEALLEFSGPADLEQWLAVYGQERSVAE